MSRVMTMLSVGIVLPGLDVITDYKVNDIQEVIKETYK